MLSADATTHEAIVAAIQFWHRNGILPVNAPAGMALAQKELTINYGYNQSQYGSIVLKLGQFEVIKASAGTGIVSQLLKYNHEGTGKSFQDYIDALKSNNIVANQKYVSRLIILTSECARSAMVEAAIQRLLKDKVTMSDAAWAGMEFAFKNYGKTATCAGYNISAKNSPWTALRKKNYLKYIDSPDYDGAKKRDKSNIEALDEYIRG